MIFGHGAFGEVPFGEAFVGGNSPQEDLGEKLAEGAAKVTLAVSTVIIPEKRLLVPERQVAEGLLIKSTSALWDELAYQLSSDWSRAFQIHWREWEEIVAGAFKNAGYDEVILTPASGDRGRDVIATKQGVGCIKIIGSVKAYRPNNEVG